LRFIGLHGGVFVEVSLKPFQRLVGAAAIGGRARKRETLLYAFSFVSGRRLRRQLSEARQFSFCACCVKRKAENALEGLHVGESFSFYIRQIHIVYPLFSLAK
jgi:hypothetical protein